MIKFFNRVQLYKEVWNTPLTKLAPVYSLSTYVDHFSSKQGAQRPSQGRWIMSLYYDIILCIGHIIECILWY